MTAASRSTGAPPRGSPDPSGSTGATLAGRELREWAARELAAAGCVSAEAEADWLLEEAADEAGLRAMVASRAAGEPLQYVIGWAPFGRLRLAVGPGVFVPRPETEGLADRAATRLRAAGPSPVAVDACAGSGAIACFLAAEVPGARVLATELDPGALAWARGNAERYGVELLAGDHEPRLALDGGPDGLDVLRRLAPRAPHWLAHGGALLCEIGEDQTDAAAAILTGAGLADVAVHPDLAGRDRVLEGTRP